MATVMALMLLGSSTFVGVVLFFVLCTVVALRSNTAAALAYGGLADALLLAALLLRGERDWLPTILTCGAGFFAFAAFAITIRRAQQARAESAQLLAELTGAQARLRDLAVMDERQRLAREMHDAVGHRLTAVAVLLEGAARLIPSEPERAARMVETSRSLVREGLTEVRAAVSALHQDASSSRSVAATLQGLADMFAQATEARIGLAVAPGLREPDPGRKIVIVRTAQEALRNVHKHAQATLIEMDLREADGSWVLTCRDNGRGPATGAGYGLGNLRARAAEFGGSVVLQPAAGGGSLLRLTVPGATGEHPRPRADRG